MLFGHACFHKAFCGIKHRLIEVSHLLLLWKALLKCAKHVVFAEEVINSCPASIYSCLLVWHMFLESVLQTGLVASLCASSCTAPSMP